MKRLLLAVAILSGCFLIWQRQSLRLGGLSSSPTSFSSIIKRSWSDDALATSFSDAQLECAPLGYPAEEQCSHVKAACAESDTVLSIHYVQKYFCAAPVARRFIFTGFIAWLAFLFSFIGIAASDFFIPNLATLADTFGLDDDIAGITFLAFGNGSPDLFSTLSAMRSGSGSLAIGELIGAASFIVSVVVGSMCIVKSFEVNKAHFVRDVGFFTAAVVLLITVLFDGLLHLWEALSLVVLYLCYVAVVVAGSIWQKRRERKLLLSDVAPSIYEREPVPEIFVDDEPYRDSPEEIQRPTPRLDIPWSPRRPVYSLSAPSPGQMSQDPHSNFPNSPSHQRRDQSHSMSRSHPSHVTYPPPPSRSPRLPSFSLLGALEFRDVVTSLRRESAAEVLSAFESPVSPMYVGGHYHVRTPSPQSLRLQRSSYFEHSRSPSPLSSDRPSSPLILSEPALPINQDYIANEQASQLSTLRPETASSISQLQLRADDESDSPKLSRRKRMSRRIARIFHVLMPTLFHLGEKKALSATASILAAPAVFLLTITLPVVVSSHHDENGVSSRDHEAHEAPLIDVESDNDRTPSPGTTMEVRFQPEMPHHNQEQDYPEGPDKGAEPGPTMNKYLIATQLILGPLWIVAVCFGGQSYGLWPELATLAAGVPAAALVLVFADRLTDQRIRLALCLMGFLASMVWIMAIADEVVQVLDTLGLIFGLSPAIIGLTIFAVGNSLADFVANFTVASFAPIMGFSACFGGPMLNILLGIGLSGSFVISQQQRGAPYEIDFSRTLLVSSCGLLGLLVGTLVFVPMNKYVLDRRWGVFLVCCYVVIMLANVCVEVVSKRNGFDMDG